MWTKEQLALLGTDTDANIGVRVGKKTMTVAQARIKRSIPSFNSQCREKDTWKDVGAVRILGTAPDADIARKLGITTMSVLHARRRRRIPVYSVNPSISWDDVSGISQPDFYLKLVEICGGSLTYKTLAEMCYVSHSRVQKWFAPGSGQDVLSMQMRHHLFLACLSQQSGSA